MTYLCIIFASPLCFAVRKNWGAFTLNAILYGFACLQVATIIGIAVAPIFWALAVGHAGWHLRRELMTQQAGLIASKMAEKFWEPAGTIVIDRWWGGHRIKGKGEEQRAYVGYQNTKTSR